MQFQGYILYWEDPKNPEAFRSIYGCLEHWTHPANGEAPKIYANRNYAESAKRGLRLPGTDVIRADIQILSVTITTLVPAPPSMWTKFKELFNAISG